MTTEQRSRRAKVGDWTWSEDGERYFTVFPTREETIQAGIRELEGAPFHLAQIREVADGAAAIKAAITEDGIRETAEDFLSDNYEIEEDRWRTSSGDLEDQEWAHLVERLHEVVDRWCEERGLRADWFVVSDPTVINPQQMSLDGFE